MITRIKTKVLKLIQNQLQEGMSVKKIALCIALGVALGIFPVLGSTTILCAIAALVFRLNLPAIQVVNYLVYPLQLILLAPFYGAGNWLFQGRSLPMIQENIIGLLKNDFWGNMVNLWHLTLYAAFTWLIISPLLILLLYSLLKPAVHSVTTSGSMANSFKKFFR